MRRSVIEYIESKQMRPNVAEFRAGDTVRVHWKVKEGDKERVQPFEGIVIRKTKGHNRATFTVRKVSYGVGVERIFPLHSPRYEKIEVLTHGSVSRSRLFYLRNLKGKASRVDTLEEQVSLPHGEAAGAPVPALEGVTATVEEKAKAEPSGKGAAAGEKKRAKKTGPAAAASK